MLYYEKYIKYKNKYLKLKKGGGQYGGGDPTKEDILRKLTEKTDRIININIKTTNHNNIKNIIEKELYNDKSEIVTKTKKTTISLYNLLNSTDDIKNEQLTTTIKKLRQILDNYTENANINVYVDVLIRHFLSKADPFKLGEETLTMYNKYLYFILSQFDIFQTYNTDPSIVIPITNNIVTLIKEIHKLCLPFERKALMLIWTIFFKTKLGEDYKKEEDYIELTKCINKLYNGQIPLIQISNNIGSFIKFIELSKQIIESTTEYIDCKKENITCNSSIFNIVDKINDIESTELKPEIGKLITGIKENIQSINLATINLLVKAIVNDEYDKDTSLLPI
jgi:hypothetical protein